MIIIINNNELKIIKTHEHLIKLVTNIKNNEQILCYSINNIINDNHVILYINTSIFFMNIYNKRILNILRHSCAHLLAHALKTIYPDVLFSIGPVIKHGFYYDFYIKNKIQDKDLIKIEKIMQTIAKKSINIIKIQSDIKTCEKIFENNKYKIHILNQLKNKKPNEVTLYKQNDFIDLCKGPHVKNTQFLKHFKLLKIAGAYWKNEKKNEMLYRIYGTIWQSKKELDTYLAILNKHTSNDHKTIGKNLNLFIFDKNSPGVVFWNKNGWKLYSNIVTYLKNKMLLQNYKEVNTPAILGDSLFKKSGHLKKFNEHMFQYKTKNNLTILKPMNCPCHAMIFNNFYKKSYKDLPFRLSEFGSCFRNELSGSLYGLMRLKNFVQDDGHIFCSEKQVFLEIIHFINILKTIYFFFNFKKYRIVLSKKPINIKNNTRIWKKAEILLEKSLNFLNLKYTTSREGAFYGPKIEISLKDNFNRIWQCGTIQIDFFTAKNLNITYSNKEGKIKNPIIIHRATLGSIERFLGILLENKNGHLPFTIAPIQFEIVYINDIHTTYAKKIYTIMKNNYKTRLSINNDRLDYKIKKCILEKIPYIIIIGEREYKSKTITIRKTKTKELKNISLNKLISKIKLNEF